MASSIIFPFHTLPSIDQPASIILLKGQTLWAIWRIIFILVQNLVYFVFKIFNHILTFIESFIALIERGILIIIWY